MNPLRRSRADALIRFAISIAPASRAGWFHAMAAELVHIPAAGRSRFVVGCLSAAVRERLVAPVSRQVVTRWLLVCGAMLWAGLNARLGGRLSVSDGSALEVFAYGMALVFAVGAAATAHFGYRVMRSLAASLAGVLVTAVLIMKLALPPSSSSALFVALMVEDLLVLALAASLAVVATRTWTPRRGPV